jgi:hypothetical protein
MNSRPRQQLAVAQSPGARRFASMTSLRSGGTSREGSAFCVGASSTAGHRPRPRLRTAVSSDRRARHLPGCPAGYPCRRRVSDASERRPPIVAGAPSTVRPLSMGRGASPVGEPASGVPARCLLSERGHHLRWRAHYGRVRRCARATVPSMGQPRSRSPRRRSRPGSPSRSSGRARSGRSTARSRRDRRGTRCRPLPQW